ncbi:MAG: NAD(P)H-dependent oxidoreductase subunit E [Elusimicrobiota bacterium]
MEKKQELRKIVDKWKDKKGNLIMVFHEIQNKYGYVPRDVSMVLAQMLDVPLARIYEVLTFYNYFKLEPPGEHSISICMGTACYLKGAGDLLRKFEEILNIKEGETTEDGLFQLNVVRCLGCCGLAPVVTIDEKVYGKVEKEDIPDILSRYTKKEKVKNA